MGRGPSPGQGEIVVDERGRTSLARVRVQEHARYFATEHEDGTITLTPALTFTPAGLDEFLADPGLRGTRRQRPVRPGSSSGRPEHP